MDGADRLIADRQAILLDVQCHFSSCIDQQAPYCGSAERD